MRKVQMCVRCAETFVELLPEDVTDAELQIEQLVSHILLEFFEVVAIDEVSITLSPGLDPTEGQPEHLLLIRAQCENMAPPFLTHDEEYLELSLEGSISCALVELLGTIGVDEVTVR